MNINSIISSIGFFEITVGTLAAFGSFFAYIIYKANDPAKLKKEAKELAYDIQVINSELDNRKISDKKREDLIVLRDEKQSQLDCVIHQLRNNDSEWREVNKPETVEEPVIEAVQKSLGQLMTEYSKEIENCYVPPKDVEYTPSGHLLYSDSIDENLKKQEIRDHIVALCEKQARIQMELKDPKQKNKVELVKLLQKNQTRIDSFVAKLDKDYLDELKVDMEAKNDSNVVHLKFGKS